jgi:hypothetical protein
VFILKEPKKNPIEIGDQGSDKMGRKGAEAEAEAEEEEEETEWAQQTLASGKYSSVNVTVSVEDSTTSV